MKLWTDPINDHLESYIVFTYDPDQYNKSGITREEFLELENPAFSYQSISEVEYFYEPNPIEDFNERQMLDDQEEIETYTMNFVSSKLFEYVLPQVPGLNFASLPYNMLQDVGEYKEGLKVNMQKVSLKRLEQTASELHLELQMYKGGVDSSLEEMEVLFQPTEKTFDLIDRWNAVYLVGADIPYPETEIMEHDWIGINSLLYGDKHKADMKSDERDLLIYDFIFNGERSNHPVVLEAIKLIESK